ncbi:N-acetylneuraminate synthase [Flagellimonas beolgyonensis]|uniref:N-acetylneuraminate synthase n=1 Tax=Flagellimonas beolgyonensis TaxID=864064 RepID=UPI000F8D0225|nr:N-acetylneuraminate synthase [Allomuricauda beolgyonensis]
MKKVLIIAEAGVNHNGDIELAKALIDVAANAGADYVKFQTFNSKKLASKNALMADYQTKNTGNQRSTQFDMLRKLELSKESHYLLKEYSEVKGIQFLSTGFDLESLQFLFDFGLDLFKIPSGEITNLPYLKKIGGFGKQTILSTGMADMIEISDALNVLTASGTKKSDITILHCNTEYPTPMHDVNLRAMKTIGKELDVKIGYSDHTLGIEVPIAAVAMGATVIEKHFTLDRNMKGPDHKASLEPDELINMVQSIRNIELALGSFEKAPTRSESKNKIIARKSIVASKNIKKGELFTEHNLTIKRPGNGISPMKWDQILGTRAAIDYNEDDLI